MCVSSQRRHSRVVGWVPVPNAKPGSSRILMALASTTSCQVGTTHRRGVTCSGANCDCVRRTQSWSSMRSMPYGVVDGSEAACSASVSTPARLASCANNATTRLVRQFSAGALPGSANNGRSLAVPAAASVTSTENAPRSSNASDSVSTQRESTIRVTERKGIVCVGRWALGVRSWELGV